MASVLGKILFGYIRECSDPQTPRAKSLYLLTSSKCLGQRNAHTMTHTRGGRDGGEEKEREKQREGKRTGGQEGRG